MKQLLVVLACSLTACALDAAPATDTDSDDLSSADVTHYYYSDATFTHVIGAVEVGVDCGPGKRSFGVTTGKYYSVDSVPCSQGIGAVSCYQWLTYGVNQNTGVPYTVLTSVTCPGDIDFTTPW